MRRRYYIGGTEVEPEQWLKYGGVASALEDEPVAKQIQTDVVTDRNGTHFVLTILDDGGNVWIRRAPLDPRSPWERVKLPWETAERKDEG